MKGIETSCSRTASSAVADRSDHCPAMKGIETCQGLELVPKPLGSDHCPAMKGIETQSFDLVLDALPAEKRPLPRNEGD